jgi:hypothetical protein
LVNLRKVVLVNLRKVEQGLRKAEQGLRKATVQWKEQKR